MKIKLLNHYPDESTAYMAAAICVGKLDTANEKNMLSAVKSGHYSILEHLPMTFLVEDVSRALTHQLVRHRIASYSQESQRYCKIDTDKDWYVTPKTVSSSDKQKHVYSSEWVENALDSYDNAMSVIEDIYKGLISIGIPIEDARMILPNATSTKIIVTLNARSFIEQCQKRLCNKAQWEIKEMYRLMKEAIKDIYPTVYGLSVPPCVHKGCPETKPCGNPYKV